MIEGLRGHADAAATGEAPIASLLPHVRDGLVVASRRSVLKVRFFDFRTITRARPLPEPTTGYATSPTVLKIACAALCPGAPVTEPQGCVPEPHSHNPSIGVL
jgi:hypothetical protein